jgi:hypothetical protein
MSDQASMPPATAHMNVTELEALVRAGGPYRGKAAFALIDRVPDDAAVVSLGELARLPAVQADRMHMITLAWAMIIGLLAGETTQSRDAAYAAFADLPAGERAEFLSYIKANTIEDAHPGRP